MVKIVFVGDTPAPGNISSDIAFVGAKCFKTIVEWIKYLRPDYYVCLNSDSEVRIAEIACLKHKENFKVIALGNRAAERLNKYNIIHFQLPHPSPRNRLLNEKEYVERELKVCYDYIHDNLVGVLSETSLP